MNTAFALFARFETPTVALDAICDEFFGLSRAKANEYAAENKLPVPTFRATDSQKAPRLVHLDDLARWLDSRRAAAAQQWEKSQIKHAA
jgi:hypothetical protein